MPITDLTGTKWLFNQNPTSSGASITYNINFASNNNSFNQLSENYVGGGDWGLVYGNSGAYNFDMGAWYNQAYRIIEITGGADVTNSNLISWLQANATQVEVTTLANTSWILNEPFEWIGDESLDAAINFTSNTENYVEFAYNPDTERLRYYSEHSGPFVTVISGGATVFPNQVYRSISIISGTDVTNPNLIAWFTNNAEYQAPTPPPVSGLYSFEQNLDKLDFSDIKFNFTPDAGYKIPNNIEVENGTIVEIVRHPNGTGTVTVSSDTTGIECLCTSGEAAKVDIEYVGDKALTVLAGASVDTIDNPILVNSPRGQYSLYLDLSTENYIRFTTDDDYFNSIEYDHDKVESLGNNSYKINAACQFTVTSSSVCVVGETKIAMEDGSFKEIKDIKRGDYIKAVNPLNNSFCTGIVTNFKVGYTKKLVLMLLSNGTELRMTRSHPVLTTDGYKTFNGYGTSGSKLEEGDEIITNDGIIYIDRLEEYSTQAYTPVYALGAWLVGPDTEVNNNLEDTSNTIWVPYIANNTISIPVAKKGARNLLGSSSYGGGAPTHGGSDSGGSTGGADYDSGMRMHGGG